MLYKAAWVLACMGVASAAKYFRNSTEEMRFMFNGFAKQYGRSYGDDEEHRFRVFVDNLRLIDERNTENVAAGGREVHGITIFADLTQKEFVDIYLHSDPSMRRGAAALEHKSDADPLGAYINDWTGIYTTPVKDQGNCGSCWAFSAVEQIESDAMRTLGASYMLSAQQVVSCDTTCYGCSGGWTENAYSYIQSAGGLESESDYPYTASNSGCTADASKAVVRLRSYTTVYGEDSMGQYVASTGPLSICVDASNWSTYTSGVLYSCGTSVNHCVQAVGVDSSSGYWKVRNQWGTAFGEQGFIYLAYGQDTCHLTNDPTYTTVY